MTEKPIYLLHHRMKWRVFKELHDKVNLKCDGPTPRNFTKILWEMLRDKQIYIWLDETREDPVQLGTKLPEGRSVMVLDNGTSA